MKGIIWQPFVDPHDPDRTPREAAQYSGAALEIYAEGDGWAWVVETAFGQLVESKQPEATAADARTAAVAALLAIPRLPAERGPSHVEAF